MKVRATLSANPTKHCRQQLITARLTNATQALLWDAVFLPFGEAQSVTTALNLRFPGQHFLIESGLHYNWHRHYDPTTGRYLQPDPLEDIAKINVARSSLSSASTSSIMDQAITFEEILDLYRQEDLLGFVDGPSCAVPKYDGTDLRAIDKDGTWAKFFMGAPRRRRRSVERYSIVKRA